MWYFDNGELSLAREARRHDDPPLLRPILDAGRRVTGTRSGVSDTVSRHDPHDERELQELPDDARDGAARAVAVPSASPRLDPRPQRQMLV